MTEKIKYNIIGDIHGRTCWQTLVKDDAQNIFVGDYLDPYTYLGAQHVINNLLNIIDYKRKHPQTVLLYGNHDLQYITDSDRNNRYDFRNAELYRQIFEQNQDAFYGVAFEINNSVLISHAGVSIYWYKKYFGEYEGEPLAEVVEKINRLWQDNKEAFTFEANRLYGNDVCGESPTHSPLWIRPWTLGNYNLLADTGKVQIFGHTKVSTIQQTENNLICVDCLDVIDQSYSFEL